MPTNAMMLLTGWLPKGDNMNEEWKEVKENDYYEVSNTGKIRNAKTKKILKAFINNSGYYCLTLYRDKVPKNYTIHRLVASNFLDKENFNVVNHIDGDSLNNKISNLEWTTQKGNIQHSMEIGTYTSTEARKALAKVVKKQIIQKDKEGNILKIWDSAKEAEESSDGYYKANKISIVASGKRKYHRNFIWEYQDKNNNRGKYIQVDMFEKESNNFIRTFNSIREVMRFLDINNYRTIKNKLKTGERFEYRGYLFEENKK